MRIITGMQRGADRGSADAAMACGLDVFGYVPRGRLAEDGRIPSKYECIELPSSDYSARTKANVLAAHATLVFTRGAEAGTGSRLTMAYCRENMRPFKHVDLSVLHGPAPATHREHLVMNIGEWFQLVEEIFLEHKPVVVNIAGSRESKAPGIQKEVQSLLEEVFRGYRIK